MERSRRRWVAILGCALLLGLAAIIRWSGAAPRQSVALEPSPPGSEAAVLDARRGGRDADAGKPFASGLRVGRARDLEGLRTATDLAMKGFPPMMGGRRWVLEPTLAQTTAEVARDLGNGWVASLTPLLAGMGDTAIDYRTLYTNKSQIQSNVKVLRLIEEGRERPDEVAGLLKQEIQACLAEFDGVREILRTDKRDAWYIEPDKYYEEHRRYENPASEFLRIRQAAYGAFYVLANIDRQAPEFLAAWIELQSREPLYRCIDMDCWLVDAYYRQAPRDAPGWGAHRAVSGGIQISGNRIKQSKWNAPYDLGEPLLAARNVNLVDLPTIEVLEIPFSLPEELDARRKETMLRNFIESFGH